MKCKIEFDDWYIDALLLKLQESSEESISNQINKVSNLELRNLLKEEARINKLSSEDNGMRKGFTEYLKASDLKFKRRNIQEFYLIETESEGEVFIGANYLYLICDEECVFLEFFMEYGEWKLSENKKCNGNVIAEYFKKVEYRYECNMLGQTAVNKLIISHIGNKSITTKYLTTVCHNDMPPIPH